MNRHSFFILPFLIALLFLVACASSGQQEAMVEEGTAVIKSLDVSDNKIVLTLSAPFEYTVYKPGDPFTVIVELPGVDAGKFRDRIESTSKGITEITPTVVDEPSLMTKLEILLQEPSKLIPEVSGNVLTLSVESADEGEMAQFEPITEEQIPDVEQAPTTDVAMGEEIPFAEEEMAPEEALPLTKPLAPEETFEEEPIAEAHEEELPAEEPSMVKGAESEPSSGQKKINITDIRFERVKDAVKVIILADGAVKPNIFPLDGRIVLDFDNVDMKATIPKEVAYPLKGIRSGEHDHKTRLVLDLMDKASYDVIAIDNSVVISLSTPDLIQQVAKGVAGSEELSGEMKSMERPGQVEAGAKGTIPAEELGGEEYIEEGRYTGKKISLDFQDAEIVPIFRLFADVSGYNVVVSPEVKGKITMKLINVPWDQALDLVLRTHNLGKQLEGNIIRIAPNKDLAAESEEKARAKDALMKAQPMVTKVYAINYAGVDRIKEAISSAKLLSPRGSMTADERASVLVVNDVADVFPRVQNLISQLDKPELQVRQVLIEARIVEINTTYVRDIGIQWGAVGRTNNFQVQGGGLETLTQSQGEFAGNNFIVNLPAAVGQGSGGAIGLGWINASRTLGLDLQLSALERTGNSKIVSNPRIITMNNTPAKITQGRTIYIPVATSDKTDVKAIDAVLSLDVTPSIAPGGAVLLKMKISKDEPGDIVAGNISINKNNAETSALINNGETVVIGGIYKTSYIKSKDAVPFLAKIPVLGWFFQKNSLNEDSAEILIFITPRVIDFDVANKK